MDQNDTQSMETLLTQLLSLTLQLEESIHNDEPDPEDWVRIIEERQAIMDEISLLQNHGVKITDDQKLVYLRKVQALDSQLIPTMEMKKSAVQKQIHNLNKSKAVNQQYMGGYGYNPYGSFFDKKK